ncbi:MAG TPA: transglycosylase domain-containing protein, partial [Glaciihabitans sp.]|nr:transglycosylase domain-containing protein [Glaciihabitans sp.]
QNRIFASQDGAAIQIATMYSQNREEVAWEQVSDFVKDAAVSGEDRRFYEHGGVDIPGIARAALKNIAGGSISEGASTITQQYVKNTFIQEALEAPTPEEVEELYYAAIDDSFDRKVKEMKLAISLEKRHSKNEILLAYLNIASFGGTTYGIESASQRYYGVSAKELTAAQAASLVAIVQAPSAMRLDYSENLARNKERRDVILGQMHRDNKLTDAEFAEALATPLDSSTLTLTEPSNGCIVANDHTRFFCDYIRNLVKDLKSLGGDAAEREASFKHGGYDIYTTLDMGVQTVAQDANWQYADKHATALQLGSATVTVEVGTGRILAMAQNKDFNNTGVGAGPSATAVNFSTDRAYGGSSGFQPGSTYKVFTLLNWLQNGHGINERVNGSARTEPQPRFTDSCGGPWLGRFPFKNDDSSRGQMSVATATQKSVNGAFVSMALRLDLCSIKRTAESLGVHRADGDPLISAPATVLGTNEVAPLTMAAAYAGIAAGGVYCVPIAIDRIVGPDGERLNGQLRDCSKVVDTDVANAAAFAMSQVMTAGTGRASNPNNGVEYIGKTGTTDNSAHTWMVGATTRAATAVWVGNISGGVALRSVILNGTKASELRHSIFRTTVTAIDSDPALRGEQFPEPSPKILGRSGSEIPDVSAETVVTASAILRGFGLTVRPGGSVVSDMAPGTVVSTSPAPGTPLPPDKMVTIYTAAQ